jgi:hypothetical protein
MLKAMNLWPVEKYWGNMYTLYVINIAVVNNQEDRVHYILAEMLQRQETSGATLVELKVKLSFSLI